MSARCTEAGAWARRCSSASAVVRRGAARAALHRRQARHASTSAHRRATLFACTGGHGPAEGAGGEAERHDGDDDVDHAGSGWSGRTTRRSASMTASARGVSATRRCVMAPTEWDETRVRSKPRGSGADGVVEQIGGLAVFEARRRSWRARRSATCLRRRQRPRRRVGALLAARPIGRVTLRRQCLQGRGLLARASTALGSTSDKKKLAADMVVGSTADEKRALYGYRRRRLGIADSSVRICARHMSHLRRSTQRSGDAWPDNAPPQRGSMASRVLRPSGSGARSRRPCAGRSCCSSASTCWRSAASIAGLRVFQAHGAGGGGSAPSGTTC